MKRRNRLGILVLVLVFTCLILLGAEVNTNASEPSVYTTENAVAACAEPVEIEPQPKYSEEELFYMAAAIYNEAGADYCSDDTRRLVGYVILNRVNDPRYPNTIKGVLEQKRQYGRFYWTGIKFASRASRPQEKHAVERAYRIAKECLEADTIPIPKTVVFQAEFKQGVKVYSHQNGIYFCHAKEVK